MTRTLTVLITPNNQASLPPRPTAKSIQTRIHQQKYETADTGGGGWNFGGLIKTLATLSESVLNTYRQDLPDFGTRLKKETVIFWEVMSQAVKELPASIHVGVSVAHGAIGKETLRSSSYVDPETPGGLVSYLGR